MSKGSNTGGSGSLELPCLQQNLWPLTVFPEMWGAFFVVVAHGVSSSPTGGARNGWRPEATIRAGCGGGCHHQAHEGGDCCCRGQVWICWINGFPSIIKSLSVSLWIAWKQWRFQRGPLGIEYCTPVSELFLSVVGCGASTVLILVVLINVALCWWCVVL